MFVRNYPKPSQQTSNVEIRLLHAQPMEQDVLQVEQVVQTKQQKSHVFGIWTKIKHVSGIAQELIQNSVKKKLVTMPLPQTLIMLLANHF